MNLFEQSVVLDEAYEEERTRCPALTAGHLRTTLSESPVSSTRETSLVRSVLTISESSTTLRKKLNDTGDNLSGDFLRARHLNDTLAFLPRRQ